MANIIAVIWDFDKTLIDGYMQDPMFEEYGVNATQFWAENNNLPQKYWDEYHIRVNADTIYLNQFIKYAREGKFKGLNNEKLKEFGTAVLNKMCTIGIIICLLVVIAIIAIIQNRKK